MRRSSSASWGPTPNAPRRSRDSRASAAFCGRALVNRCACGSRPKSPSSLTRASPTPRTSRISSRRSKRGPFRLLPMETPTTDVGGLLLVDKPPGVTSHDVVAIVRRVVGSQRVGHTGTLDPFATGLLVVLVGRGTRLIPYVDGEPKVYDASITFGAETDTDDATGDVVREATPPRDADIGDAIERLTGAIDQVPPAYSAKKVAGTRAYAAARRGAALDLEPSRVTVHRWELAKLI